MPIRESNLWPCDSGARSWFFQPLQKCLRTTNMDPTINKRKLHLLYTKFNLSYTSLYGHFKKAWKHHYHANDSAIWLSYNRPLDSVARYMYLIILTLLRESNFQICSCLLCCHCGGKQHWTFTWQGVSERKLNKNHLLNHHKWTLKLNIGIPGLVLI
jgi:hypothetical protein